MTQKVMVCRVCEYAGPVGMRGHLGVEVALWMFFIVPGVVYSIWRRIGGHDVCRQCGAGGVVAPDSIEGREIWLAGRY